MQNKIFADSNIWLYALMEGDSAKKSIAGGIILRKNVVISVQVVNEISVNLIKKANYTDKEILVLLKNLKEKYVISGLNYRNLTQSAEIRIRYKLSFWDSLIISSALQNSCDILYTEDLHQGLIIENTLKVVNPFDKVVNLP
ncbi:MAG: PIN domain-containing protein [Bacteroidales bacterium]|nr:PIN domain-containing protein [Bacteroidales bacterium]